MKLIIMTSLLIMIISNVMMMVASILSKKTFFDREKSSPFECGFDPKSSSRIPFSLRFFLITIIFLIFDVEIALLFPIIPLMNNINLLNWTISVFFFLIILTMGLIHEWNEGALEWTS